MGKPIVSFIAEGTGRHDVAIHAARKAKDVVQERQMAAAILSAPKIFFFVDFALYSQTTAGYEKKNIKIK